MGMNIVDLMMKFDIKETECAKISRSDPLTCAFKPGFFVVRHETGTKEEERNHLNYL